MTGSRVWTIVLVTLVTLLVWAFAEGESLRSDTRQNVRLRVTATPDLTVSLTGSEWTGVIRTLRVQGPSTSIAKVLDRVSGGIEIVPGRDVSGDPGESTINLREVLSRHPDFAGTGVRVQEVEPATLALAVDRMVSLEARVVVPLPPGDSAFSAQANPATVRVSVPQRLLASESFKGFAAAPEVRVRVPADALDDITPSAPLVLSAAELAMPQEVAPGVRIDPRSVRVTITRRVRESSKVLTTVPVHIRLPAVIASTYEIQVEPDSETVDEVTLTGPSDLVDQTGLGGSFQYQVVAEVELLPSEIEAALAGGTDSAVLTRQVELRRFLPPGISWDAPSRFVRLRVSRRATPEGGGE
ncbi:MAG: hypothetical protein IT439_06395 [Phycisphaerales bacterium]|nr:hypothetical protein [Phycisphaerales bacterium]